MILPPRVQLTSSPVIDASIILGASLLTAWLTDLFLTKVLRRVVTTTKSELDDRIIGMLHRPIFFTVLLVGAAMALETLGVTLGALPLLQTLLILIWVLTLLRISAVLFDSLLLLAPGDSSAGRQFAPLLRNLTAIALLVLGIMGILLSWGISITPLLASAGLAGAAVAFAAKDSIANFLGGISILVDRPYTVGHYIVLESGERGEVVDIGLRSTRLKTRDDILVTVPNSIMANSRIVNESAPVRRFRMRIPVGVAYGSDLQAVEEILLNVAGENPGVEKEPPPRVRFRTFGESSLNFELLCWAGDPVDRGRIIHELNVAVYDRFNEEGVRIPFPQRDVHLHKSQG